MSERPQYYILSGRTPFAVDVLTWGKWFGASKDRFIADTVIDDTPTEYTLGLPGNERKYMRPKIRVSTVFIGIDHNWRETGEPILFETMIFGGALDQEQWRWSTYDEAERGHEQAVTQARIANAQIKSIKDKTGAT